MAFGATFLGWAVTDDPDDLGVPAVHIIVKIKGDNPAGRPQRQADVTDRAS